MIGTSIKVEALYAGYNGLDVIKNIALEASGGEFLCIAGPNGSGKSTLLRAVARLIPCRGRVTVEGRDTGTMKRGELAKKIAILGQASQFYFPYTVYETVALGRYAYGKGFLPGLEKKDRGIIDAVLRRLELDSLAGLPITGLSGGQLQRVFLARTLVQNPAIILLDEPTNHLDLKYQVELLRYLGNWADDEGGIVIAVLHDLNLARCFSRRMILLDGGELKTGGNVKDVLESAALEAAYGMNIPVFMREALKRWESSS
ncbi:MAG: ABC transporter ATP-binding protein [Treponema sp.]|jgi:iron complex transport system ATP-binding protein|nr:ABC transporter ATP-binding protein [Treponema sp.]